MGIAAIFIGSLNSVGLASFSFSQSFDVITFFCSALGLIGSILARWRKGAGITLLVLVTIYLLVIGYRTTEMYLLLSGIIYMITAVLAAARRPAY